MGEFELIRQYFTRETPSADLGVGDDAALLRVKAGHQLVVSADMLVAGRHFFEDADPCLLGWKSLAVNVSDLAAMGAQPKWATLAIALPAPGKRWVEAFSRGLFACAETFGVELVGGDTTRGPLTISIQIMGEVPTGKALRRDGAQAADDIWVSGMLGSAAAGLAHLQHELELSGKVAKTCLQALHQPMPRLELGLALRGVAHSCIDVSDGLLSDLGHVLQASRLDARLMLEDVPCLGWLGAQIDQPHLRQRVLAGGDDYELCFTAPRARRRKIHQLAETLRLPLTRIGETMAMQGKQPDLTVWSGQKIVSFQTTGFDHFA